jgi:redox-sensing transcriptional repressor
MDKKPISVQTLKRLPTYYNFLLSLPPSCMHISATTIAKALGLHDVQVRKDLACISDRGRPRVGYPVTRLREDIQSFLYCRTIHSAVLVGTDSLGRAILSYADFSHHGWDIAAAFDPSDKLAGSKIYGKQVVLMEKMPELCQRMHVHIGILATDEPTAHALCPLLIRCGIRAIWNFTQAQLEVPPDIFVQNENLDVSLWRITQFLTQKQEQEAKETLYETQKERIDHSYDGSI